MFGKKKKRIAELEMLCAEMYQVVGEMSSELGIFDHAHTELILDKLSAASNSLPIPQNEVLPFHVGTVMQDLGDTWGYHAFFDCKACDKQVITNGDMLRKFSRDLVTRIDMVAHGQPQVEHFATHDPQKGGYTLLQMISTSAIAGHFVDLTGDCYLDIFSCKPFDLNVTHDFITDFLKPEKVTMRFVRRQA